EHPVDDDDRGSVIAVDLDGNKETLANNITETGLAWSADGNEIWFSGSDNQMSTSLEAVTFSGRHRLITRVAGRMELYDVSRDGRVLFGRDYTRLGIIGLAPGETK